MKWTKDKTVEYRSGEYQIRGNNLDGWALRRNDEWICWAHDLERAKRTAKRHAEGKCPLLSNNNEKEGVE